LGNTAYDSDASSIAAVSSVHDFRHCEACHALFSDREDFKGFCPASGRAHVSDQRFNYTLFFGLPDNPQLQGAWRRCQRCQAIYFDGFPDKHQCDAREGVHLPDPRLTFVLPHDIQATTGREAGWEFCTKCKALFRNQDNENSHCAAGANHEFNPGAFHFVLSHGLNPPRPPGPIDSGTDLHPVDD
jgi:hypothetical protein